MDARGSEIERASPKYWSVEQAQAFLEDLGPDLERAGFKARIVGSVGRRGYSTHDLDLVVTPLREDNDFADIAERFNCLCDDIWFELTDLPPLPSGHSPMARLHICFCDHGDKQLDFIFEPPLDSF